MDSLNRICVISGFRLRTLESIGTKDISYSLPIPHIWSVLEPTIAICTACLPVARPVFLRVLSSSASKPLARHSFHPNSAGSYGSAEAKVGPFRRLSEQEVPLKEMTRSQVTSVIEAGDNLETPSSKHAVAGELERITVI